MKNDGRFLDNRFMHLTQYVQYLCNCVGGATYCASPQAELALKILEAMPCLAA